jgi:hypothetical protein
VRLCRSDLAVTETLLSLQTTLTVGIETSSETSKHPLRVVRLPEIEGRVNGARRRHLERGPAVLAVQRPVGID